jgi:tyrosinase
MRRHQGSVIFVFLVVLFTSTINAQTPMRMSWQTFAKDPARVAAFRKAVVAMKLHDLAAPATPESRTGWEYWGNMHGYFGPKSTFGTIMQFVNKRQIDLSIYSLYFYGVHNLIPPDAVAEAVWSQCQHGTGYFFPWHRLYLL